MHVLADRIKESTATTGTGQNVTLSGAKQGFIAFDDASAITDGCTVYYVIEEGFNFEVGIGTWHTGDILKRNKVLSKLESGVYTENPATRLNLAGSATVFCSLSKQTITDITAPKLNPKQVISTLHTTRYTSPAIISYYMHKRPCWSPGLGLFAMGFQRSGPPLVEGIVTSPDGVTWTERTVPSNQYVAICWSPELGKFLAISDDSATLTSTDGVTWTAHVSNLPGGGSDLNRCRVCWSPELALFVGTFEYFTPTENRVRTSPDGITWTDRTYPLTKGAGDVCWSPELRLFVTIASWEDSYQQVCTSPDGITWTARDIGTAWGLSAVCWSPEQHLFVAVRDDLDGLSPGVVMTSLDGINWTHRSGPSQTWEDVCWAPELGLFLAVSSYTNTGNWGDMIMVSPNGIDWTLTANSVAATLGGVVWGT